MNDSTEQRQPKFPQSEPLGAEFDLETYQVAPTFEELTEKLSEDATPEEKDHFWYTHIYRGDRVPPRSRGGGVGGGGVGVAVCLSPL